MQRTAQVHASTWSRGRVVLLGDAAYCASPISGMGTSLALAGAYVLAGEQPQPVSAPTIPIQGQLGMRHLCLAHVSALRLPLCPYAARFRSVVPWACSQPCSRRHLLRHVNAR
jgi:hypothetical protein